jgi:hypothetical protein
MLNMIDRPIRTVTISDIHLGHKRNPTLGIIQALDAFFKNYIGRGVDILFLAGDVFDQLLDLPSDEVAEITMWAHRLIEFCEREKIKLRILEGTPSHDWKQSAIFVTAHTAMRSKCDFKYIDTLHIEHMEDFGLHVLYVPDEWHSSTERTFKDVQALMQKEGLSKVDLAIMHGSFAYQLPAAAMKSPKHSEHDYLSIVKYFICIGHVHTHSIFERILAQGSFDRLAHGEEEAKGGIECVIYPDGTFEHFFIENKMAKTFKTFTLRGKDIDDAISMIANRTKNFLPNSYVRIRAPKDHPAIIGFDEFKKRFPHFVVTKITPEEEELENHSLVDDLEQDSDYVPITITRENITSMLMEEINSKHSLTAAQQHIALCTMEEVI